MDYIKSWGLSILTALGLIQSKKIRHPKNNSIGWPDNKGNVWVPTGPNAHRGPHWDVQLPDGGYVNVMPGGRILGKKK